MLERESLRGVEVPATKGINRLKKLGAGKVSSEYKNLEIDSFTKSSRYL